jgi:hypothetical protein
MGISTPRQAILAMCTRCLCLTSTRSGHDCLGRTCFLYPAMPWRGKHPSKSIQPQGTPAHEDERMMEFATSYPKRRPSRKQIHDQCMTCVPDECDAGKLVDCTGTDCPLFPLRPMQPGGMPKSEAHVAKYRRAREHGAPPVGSRKGS